MGLKTFIRNTKKKHRPVPITFGITVCNEAAELNALLKGLVKQAGRSDLILILQDVTVPNPDVDQVIHQYRKKIRHIRSRLNDNFAEFKNQLIKAATGEYLFQVDADELLSDDAVKLLKRTIRENLTVDSWIISRENYVTGLTAAHVQKWNWQLDEKGRINYPDPQPRIFKTSKNIFWKNKVHEVLTGFEYEAMLPPEIYLIHQKAIGRQESQNAYYETL